MPYHLLLHNHCRTVSKLHSLFRGVSRAVIECFRGRNLFRGTPRKFLCDSRVWFRSKGAHEKPVPGHTPNPKSVFWFRSLFLFRSTPRNVFGFVGALGVFRGQPRRFPRETSLFNKRTLTRQRHAINNLRGRAQHAAQRNRHHHCADFPVVPLECGSCQQSCFVQARPRIATLHTRKSKGVKRIEDLCGGKTRRNAVHYLCKGRPRQARE